LTRLVYYPDDLTREEEGGRVIGPQFRFIAGRRKINFRPKSHKKGHAGSKMHFGDDTAAKFMWGRATGASTRANPAEKWKPSGYYTTGLREKRRQRLSA
jgi:hypothetical protein